MLGRWFLSLWKRSLRAGPALIAAVWMLAGCAAEGPIESTDPVADVKVTPTAETLRVGEGVQLYADPRDARGRVLKGRPVSAVSQAPGVVSLLPGGVASAVAPGAAQITVTSEGRTATVAITVLAPAGPVAECQTPRSGWLWCDDFEQDRLGQYFEYSSADGRFVRAEGVGYAGSSGMRVHFEPKQVDAGSLHLAIGKTPSAFFRAVDGGTAVHREVYWRFYLRYAPSWVGGGGNKVSRAQSLAASTFAQAMIAHVWSGSMPGDHVPIDRLGLDPWTGIGWRGKLETSEYNDFPHLRGLGTAYTRTTLFDRLHTGKWQCIEAHARLNDPGRSNGLFELWLADQPEAKLTGLDWIGSFRDFGINAVYLENYWNDGAPQAQERYFDNFVVSTERIGCLK
ncbi:MAG TPA: hypothetical protein VFZ82_07720 [Methylomirabilota bacterium]|nr:hypothetical protein [Methylomirabilota bacterium]